jgi:hypothetical protein
VLERDERAALSTQVSEQILPLGAVRAPPSERAARKPVADVTTVASRRQRTRSDVRAGWSNVDAVRPRSVSTIGVIRAEV